MKYWVLRIELLSIHNTMKYPWQPSATVGNHVETHQIPLDTFGNPEYSNYLLFKRFFATDTKQQQKMETTDHLQNTNIPATAVGNWVFDGIWVANIKYRILSNIAKYYMGTSLYTVKKGEMSMDCQGASALSLPCFSVQI